MVVMTNTDAYRLVRGVLHLVLLSPLLPLQLFLLFLLGTKRSEKSDRSRHSRDTRNNSKKKSPQQRLLRSTMHNVRTTGTNFCCMTGNVAVAFAHVHVDADDDMPKT